MSWSIRNAVPYSLADIPCVVYESKLYCFGGYKNSPTDITNHTLSYNPDTDSWREKTPMPTARWGAYAALVGSKAYVFAGRGRRRRRWLVRVRRDTNVCECYDIENDSWSTKTPVPSPIAHQGGMAAAVRDKIYLFWGAYTYLYDPESDSYSARASSPISCRWGTCAYVNVHGEDRIYIIGGIGQGGTLDDNRYYKPGTDEWVTGLARAPYASRGQTRDNPVWNNKIYYTHGQYGVNLSMFFKKAARYDPLTDTWETLPDAKHPRDGVGCGIIDGKLYVVGGRDQCPDSDAHGLNNNEELVLPRARVSALASCFQV